MVTRHGVSGQDVKGSEAITGFKGAPTVTHGDKCLAEPACANAKDVAADAVLSGYEMRNQALDQLDHNPSTATEGRQPWNIMEHENAENGMQHDALTLFFTLW